jgi:hypothetical protein
MVTFVPTPKDYRFKDRTGQKYGAWTVLGLVALRQREPFVPFLWRCRCDCGTERTVSGSNLASGASKSCGCRIGQVPANAMHGASGSAMYQIWCGIKARCNNPKHVSFSNYGGRGIAICLRWMEGDGERSGFECFAEDMGPRPSSLHSVERRDNNGDYSPDNCIWATKADQSRNRRANHRVMLHEREMCLFDALRTIGLSDTTYYRRIARGWSEHRALHEPVHERHRRKL